MTKWEGLAMALTEDGGGHYMGRHKVHSNGKPWRSNPNLFTKRQDSPILPSLSRSVTSKKPGEIV